MARRKRVVHIDDREWTYSAHEYVVEIRDPENRKHLVRIGDFPALAGWTPDLIERAKWKDAAMPPVTPALVKHYIETAILGRPLPPFTEAR